MAGDASLPSALGRYLAQFYIIGCKIGIYQAGVTMPPPPSINFVDNYVI